MADFAQLRLNVPADAARDAVAASLSAQGFTVQLAPSGGLDVSRGSLGTTLVAGALAGQDMHVRFDVQITPIDGGALVNFQHSSVGGFFKGGAIGVSKAADVVREAAHSTGTQLAQQGLVQGTSLPESHSDGTASPPAYAEVASPYVSAASIPPPIDYAGRTNVVAIVALILGFLFPIGGIVAGAVSLAQIKRTGERGRGLAIGGIIAGSILTVIGIVSVVFLFIFAAVAASQEAGVSTVAPSTGSQQPGEAPGTGADTGDVFALEIGQCLDDVPSGLVSDVNVIDCASPHTYEVYSEFTVPGDVFPGTDQLDSIADEGCYPAFAAFAGLSYEESALDYLYLSPTEESWTVGDRRVSCLITDPAGQSTGSLAGAAR